MKLTLHHPDDLDRLRERVSAERHALQRDRYRAVLVVVQDTLEGGEVARRVGRSPRFVDEWAGRYRRGGLAALTPRKPPGQRPRLAATWFPDWVVLHDVPFKLQLWDEDLFGKESMGGRTIDAKSTPPSKLPAKPIEGVPWSSEYEWVPIHF